MDKPSHASHEDICAAAISSQSLYNQWAQTNDPAEREALIQLYHQSAVRLLELLRPDLERLAYRWLRSDIASDVTSLTLNLFTSIIFALPNLKIDPDKNVRALLLTIAHRGAYDLNGREGAGRRRHASMSDTRTAEGELSIDEVLYRLASADHLDTEEAWVRQIDDRMCLDIIRDYWEMTLSPLDRQIVTLRLQGIAFQKIAERLEGTYAVAALRKRYQRVIDRTRDYLQQLGWL